MIKYIAMAVMAIAIVFSVYIELKTPKSLKIDSTHTVETSTKTKESAKPQEGSVTAADNAQASTKNDMPEMTTKEVEYTGDDDEISPKEREDDKAPVVSRQKLIGGADVEWIEPKAKSPDNRFGLPPQ